MTSRSDGGDALSVEVPCRGPFDLELCLKAMHSFGGAAANAAAPPTAAAPQRAVLRLGVRVDGRPAVIEARQMSFEPPVVRVEARPRPQSAQKLRTLATRVLNADLNLGPFYKRAEAHPVLGPLTREFSGLKPFRPASLFDMLVTAVVEQQISLAAARKIRERIVARFGDEADGEPVFPAPERVAAVPLDFLTECGLSRRKAEYIAGVAEEITSGRLDLEALERASDDEVRARIVTIRGFGSWSAEYVLIRGLARADAVPVDDLAVRVVIGKLLGDGTRPSPARAAELLEPLAPFRGLAAFYLLVADRLGSTIRP